MTSHHLGAVAHPLPTDDERLDEQVNWDQIFPPSMM
jgi:hypothetical protein